MLWAFRLPDGRPQLGVITNSRSGMKPIKELFGLIDGEKPIDHYFLRFRIQAVRLSVRPGEYFFGYKYFAAGKVQDEAEGDSYKALHDRFRKAGFSVNMADEVDHTSSAREYAGSDANLRMDDKEEIPF